MEVDMIDWVQALIFVVLGLSIVAIWYFTQSRFHPKGPHMMIRPVVDRIGIDVGKVSWERLKTTMNHVTTVCLSCRHRKACHQWLNGAGSADAFCRFCPNAAFFKHLTR